MTGFVILAAAAASATLDDQEIVSHLDRVYQAAVKRNDATKMDGILHAQFQPVLGNGPRISRAELIGEARRAALEGKG